MSHPLRDLFVLTVILSSGLSLPAFGAGPSQSELDAAGQSIDSWVMTNKSYDGHRYVNLIQIMPDNAAQLKEVCAFDSGVAAPAQSTPVPYEGRIFFSIGPTTVAVDPMNCNEIWRHEWKLKGKALSASERADEPRFDANSVRLRSPHGDQDPIVDRSFETPFPGSGVKAFASTFD